MLATSEITGRHSKLSIASIKKEHIMAASVVKSFREFANGIRQPSPYCPVVTELKGITNLGVGSMQLLVSQYMKYSNNPYLNGLSARHVQIGKEAIYRGVIQFTPGFVFSMSMVYLVRKMETDSL